MVWLIAWVFRPEFALAVITVCFSTAVAFALATQPRNIRLAHYFFGATWVWALGCILELFMKSGLSPKVALPSAFFAGGILSVLLLVSCYWVERNRTEAAPAGISNVSDQPVTPALPAPAEQKPNESSDGKVASAHRRDQELRNLQQGVDRGQFLQELNRDLLNFLVYVRLNRPYTAEQLGHFRILMKMKPGWWLPEQKQQGRSFWLAVKDGSVKWRDEVKRRPITVIEMAGLGDSMNPTYNPEAKWSLLDLDFSKTKVETTNVLMLGGNATALGLPEEKLGDLDQMHVEFFCDESLISKIRDVEIQANGFRLSEMRADHLGDHQRLLSYDWPLPLTAEESKSRWVRLSPKTSAPTSIEGRWVFDFNTTTPKRVEEHAEKSPVQ